MRTSDRWPEVESALDRLLDLEVDEREGELERICADDEELRRLVSRYLRAAALPGPLDGSLGDRAGDLIADLLAEPRDEGLEEGRRIGAYEVERRLGAGGMGTVYLARRADGLFQRNVALKVLRQGMGDGGAMSRFHRERQILAGLRHPHIARLLDGGVTPEGVPFLVLEHVDGVPITSYCATHGVNRDGRIRLLLQACSGIAYAHRQGVIHRDLKPSNLLVEQDDDGAAAVSVLDFGIATHADQLDLTVTGHVIGTPGYMAPEQAAGDRSAVDRRSDVFSIGVVLFELLCERHPFDQPGAAGWVAARARREPIPPRRLVPSLPRDLETILLRCLEAEPSRRYDSVRALADDLDRYLDGRPIAARPVGPIARLWRRAQRHRAAAAMAVTAAAVALLSAAALVAGGVRYARDVEHERSRAVAARGEAEALLDFMLGDLHRGLMSIGRLDLLDQVAHRSLAYYDSQAGDSLSVAALERRGQTLYNVGLVLEAQGDIDAARRSYAEFRAIAARLVAEEPDAFHQVRLAKGEQAVAERDLEQGDLDLAIEGYLRAVSLTRSLLERTPPEDVPLREVHVQGLSALGWAYREAGEFERSAAVLDEAVAVALAEVARHPERSDDRRPWRHLEAVAGSYLGLTWQSAGDPRRALAEFNRALEICTELVGLEPANVAWLEELQLVHGRVASARQELGDLAEALASLRAGLAISQRLVAREPTAVNWQRELGVTHSEIAAIEHRLGHLASARSSLERALAISRLLAEEGPTDPSAQNDLAWDLLAMGRLERDAGNPEEAARRFEEAAAVMERIGPAELVYYRDTWAQVLLELERVEEARPVVAALLADGWDDPELLALCERHGLLPPPTPSPLAPG